MLWPGVWTAFCNQWGTSERFYTVRDLTTVTIYKVSTPGDPGNLLNISQVFTYLAFIMTC